MNPRLARARASLEGLSVGDAFGERFFLEPLSARRLIAARAMPAGIWRYTDDTQLALSIYEELLERGSIDPRSLARRFAEAYVRNPHRGYGATAHDVLTRIALGLDWEVVSREVHGGEGSMGNGGAMRVAPLGAYFANDLDQLLAEARDSARPTHAHPEGQAGAIAVAVAAAHVETHRSGGLALLEAAHRATPDGPTREGIAAAMATDLTLSPEHAAERLGNGSRVIASDTVPFSLWCAARHTTDFVEAMWSTVSGLGDRDTTCAIVGGIVALAAPVPPDWVRSREPLPVA
ncbi:MAG: ADP-ribosylglycohydrolase family protein [Deltaproteobacteria bacterium]|nr:ADP-ribosylglycohydrolase family protein [Deltaproteobacteria bacterium]